MLIYPILDNRPSPLPAETATDLPNSKYMPSEPLRLSAFGSTLFKFSAIFKQMGSYTDSTIGNRIIGSKVILLKRRKDDIAALNATS